MTRAEHAIPINGTVLYATDQGEGIPLIWTHGLLGNRELEEDIGVIEWRKLEKKFRVIRYDVRGHGCSKATLPFEDYRWDTLLADLIGICDYFDAHPFVAGGQSMGAVISLFAATIMPERIRGLILLTPPALWEEGKRHGEVYEMAAAILETEGLQSLLSLMREQHDLADRKLLSSPEITEKFISALSKQKKEVLASIFKGAARSAFPPREQLAKIRVPTLILTWTGDELHPARSAEELHRLIPHSELYLATHEQDISKWTEIIENFLYYSWQMAQ